MSIWNQIQETREELKSTLKLAKELGFYWAKSKAVYESAKSLRTLELLEQGRSATAIDKLIKGDPQVNKAMEEMDRALVEYDNAKEAINVLKKDYDYLREQYQREWNESGWSNR